MLGVICNRPCLALCLKINWAVRNMPIIVIIFVKKTSNSIGLSFAYCVLGFHCMIKFNVQFYWNLEAYIYIYLIIYDSTVSFSKNMLCFIAFTLLIWPTLFQISEAKVTITEPKPGVVETVIIISGTPEQTHAAQSLIQAFVMSETKSSWFRVMLFFFLIWSS